MKKRILSIVMMLAIALSLAVGTALVAGAANDGDYLGTSANLADSVTVQVKFQFPEGIFASATAKVGDKEAVDVTADVTVDGTTITVPVDVPIKDIDKVIEITAYDFDENPVVNAHNTMADGITPLTAKAYLESLVSDVQFGGIAQATLAYGETAKTYFSANRNTLTAPAAPAFAAEDTKFAPSGSVTGIKHRSCTLMLEEKTSIRYYFTVTEGEIGDYTFKVDGVAQAPTLAGDRYYVEATDIVPTGLGIAHTVEVSKDAETYTCAYSAVDYAVRAFDNTEDDTDAKKAVAEKLYSYYNAAISIPSYITVNYEANGGEITSETTEKYLSGTSFTLPTAFKGEDLFDGWYLDAAFTQKATEDALKAQSADTITLYAKWVKVVYTTTSMGPAHSVNAAGSTPFDLKGILERNNNYVTWSFKANGDYTYADTDTSSSVIFYDNSFSNASRIFLVQVNKGKIYFDCDGSGWYKEVGTFANQDKIDVVMHFEFTSETETTINLACYVNGAEEPIYSYDKKYTNCWLNTADDLYIYRTSADTSPWNKYWWTFNGGSYTSSVKNHTVTVYEGKYVGKVGATNSINYNANGGTMTSEADTYSTSFTTGNAEITLPTAANGAAPFVGWYFDKAGTVKATPEAIANQVSDVTLFAKYIPVIQEPKGGTYRGPTYTAANPFMLGDVLKETGGYVSLKLEFNEGFTNNLSANNAFSLYSAGDQWANNHRLFNVIWITADGKVQCFDGNTSGSKTLTNVSDGKTLDIVVKYNITSAGQTAVLEYYIEGEKVNTIDTTKNGNFGTVAAITSYEDYNFKDPTNGAHCYWWWRTNSFSTSPATITVYGGNIYA